MTNENNCVLANGCKAAGFRRLYETLSVFHRNARRKRQRRTVGGGRASA